MDISQPEPNNGWTRYHTKETDQHRKNIKESLNTPKTATIGSIQLPHLTDTQLYWMRETYTNNSKTDLGTPKHQPIYVNDVTTFSPLIQLLEQIAKQYYELKALSNNQIKIQPKTYESYPTITQSLTEKRTKFHTYRLKK
jgi:hypothetical protein